MEYAVPRQQAEFDALERDKDGYLRIPSGDWSQVDFGSQGKLIFEAGCKLGDGCELGDWCTLGDGCTLGDSCELGDWCTLGDGCTLGNVCILGDGCILGDRSKLGDWCILGNVCILGDRCTLENGKVANATYFTVSNIGSQNRTAYAYCNTETGEIFVRAGCWFSDIDDFVERVKNVHGGTQHETDYLAFADFARARFARYRPKTEHDEGEQAS